MFTMDDLFEIAIKMENNAGAIYKDCATKQNDPQIKTTLEWMASEEAAHAKWFSQLKNSLKLKIEEADLKEMVPSVLQDMIGGKTLSLEDIDFSKITTIENLFHTFIGFEKDTIAFYETLEMFIEDEEVIKGLKKIIKEENNHIQILKSKTDS